MINISWRRTAPSRIDFPTISELSPQPDYVAPCRPQ